MEQDLSKVSTEDLLDHLKERFDSLVFIGHINGASIGNSDKDSEYYLLAPGDIHNNFGMLSIARMMLVKTYEDG